MSAWGVFEVKLHCGSDVIKHTAGVKVIEQPTDLGVESNSSGGKKMVSINYSAIHRLRNAV